MYRLCKLGKFKLIVLLLLILPIMTGCKFKLIENQYTTPAMQETIESIQVEENGVYTSKEEVAAYIHKYQKLPSNYITEQEAKKLGWESKKGNLNKVAPEKSIGGAMFQNKEQLLAIKEGRQYYTCDVNYTDGFRNDDRIVYSNDGMIYYTTNAYKSFELLYNPEV